MRGYTARGIAQEGSGVDNEEVAQFLLRYLPTTFEGVVYLAPGPICVGGQYDGAGISSHFNGQIYRFQNCIYLEYHEQRIPLIRKYFFFHA